MEGQGLLSILNDWFFSSTGLFYLFVAGIAILQSKLIYDQKNKINTYEDNACLLNYFLKEVIENQDASPYIKNLAEETINKLKPVDE